MNLSQAMIFSRLSDEKFDGCTWAFNLGVKKYCDMHDRVLYQLVRRTHALNKNQYEYLESIGIYFADYKPTELDAHRLFRDGLSEKVDSKKGLAKVGYWLVKWGYYSAVYLWTGVEQCVNYLLLGIKYLWSLTK